MKKLMNIMVLVCIVTVLSTIILYAGGTGQVTNDRAIYLDDEPNEPEFAGLLTDSIFHSLDDDPNEPGPEFERVN